MKTAMIATAAILCFTLITRNAESKSMGAKSTHIHAKEKNAGTIINLNNRALTLPMVNFEWFQSQAVNSQIIAVQASTRDAKPLRCLLIPIPAKTGTRVEIIDRGISGQSYLDDMAKAWHPPGKEKRVPSSTVLVVDDFVHIRDALNANPQLRNLNVVIPESILDNFYFSYRRWPILIIINAKENASINPVMVRFTPRKKDRFWVPLGAGSRGVELAFTCVFAAHNESKAVTYTNKAITGSIRENLPDFVVGRFFDHTAMEGYDFEFPSERLTEVPDPICIKQPRKTLRYDFSRTFSKNPHLEFGGGAIKLMHLRLRPDDDMLKMVQKVHDDDED